MIHHIELFKLRPEVTPAKLEEMMMNTRMILLKIPEVLSVKCGKKVDPKNEWPFFIALEFESTGQVRGVHGGRDSPEIHGGSGEAEYDGERGAGL